MLTDIAIQIPAGYYGQIAPKSGLATLHEIDIRVGVIDPDYTGNIGVVIRNDSQKPFKWLAGNPIAQLLFIKVATPFLVPVDHFDDTAHRPHGFGAHDNVRTLY